MELLLDEPTLTHVSDPIEDNSHTEESLEPDKTVSDPVHDPELEELIKIYSCPISHQLMKDPVMADDGYTYEKEMIDEVLKNKKVSPMTRENISDRLVPNRLVKSSIENLLQQYPILEKEIYTAKLSVHELEKAILEGTQLKRKFSITSINKGLMTNILDKLDYYLPFVEDINGVSADNYTLLQWACAKGRLDVVKRLLDKGAKHIFTYKNDQTTGHISPLGMAIVFHQREVVDFLIKNGCNINEKCHVLVTPLQQCIAHKNQTGLEICLEYGADVTEHNLAKYAYEKKAPLEITETLLNYGMRPSASGLIGSGYSEEEIIDIMSRLQEKEYNFSASTCLKKALEKDKNLVAAFLLQIGVPGSSVFGKKKLVTKKKTIKKSKKKLPRRKTSRGPEKKTTKRKMVKKPKRKSRKKSS